MVASGTDSPRVVLVGDDGDLVRAAVNAFDETGTVTVAASPDEAVELLAERNYDCAVLNETNRADPVSTTLPALLDQEPTLPVIVVTSDPASAGEALEAGAADVFVRHGALDEPTVLGRRIENVSKSHGDPAGTGVGLGDTGGVLNDGNPTDQETELEQLRSVLDALPNEVYMLDIDGNFRSVVPASDREKTLSGYDPGDLIGEHVTTVLAGDDFEAGQAAVRRLITDESTERVSFEADVQTDAGEAVPHDVHVAPLQEGPGDRVTGTVGVLYDITDRLERERRLRQERDFVELTLDTIDDAFYLLDENGDLERWNETMRVVTGYSDDELGSMNALDFFDGADRERVGDAIARTLEEGSARVEADFVRKDGKTIPFEFTGAKLTDRDGTPRGVVGIGRDVAGRKEREEKLRQIRENAADVIWMTPPERDVISFISDSYEEIWGRPTETLQTDPNSFLDGVHRADRERVERALDDLPRNPDAYDETYRVVQPDGDVRWVRDRASGVTDDKGEFSRIVGVATDITERKERELELELKNRAMDEAPIGITIHDADDADATITYANDGLADLTGYDIETLGEDWLSVLRGPETSLKRVAELERGMERQEAVRTVILFYRADGTPFWSRINLAPVEHDGEVTHFVGFQQDVTASKKHEQEIERRLDEFSDVLAEELHAPIEEARRELETARENGTESAVVAADQWLEQVHGLIDDLATVHSFSVKSRETADAMTSDDGDDQ